MVYLHFNFCRLFKLFSARQDLWQNRQQFDECQYNWYNQPFKGLDIKNIGKKVYYYYKTLRYMEFNTYNKLHCSRLMSGGVHAIDWFRFWLQLIGF